MGGGGGGGGGGGLTNSSEPFEEKPECEGLQERSVTPQSRQFHIRQAQKPSQPRRAFPVHPGSGVALMWLHKS